MQYTGPRSNGIVFTRLRDTSMKIGEYSSRKTHSADNVGTACMAIYMPRKVTYCSNDSNFHGPVYEFSLHEFSCGRSNT